jgi:hypothetical protein
MRHAATFVLVLAVAASIAAWAEGPNPREGRPDQPRMRGDSGQGAGPGGPGADGGAPPPRGTPFERDFFPPELVLRNQLALGVSSEQLKVLKELINEAHAKVLDLQTDLERVTEQFKTTIAPARVDEKAALAQADQMLNLEVRIKRAQLTLLVGVKNALTEKQQEKLRTLRSPRPEGEER